MEAWAYESSEIENKKERKKRLTGGMGSGSWSGGMLTSVSSLVLILFVASLKSPVVAIPTGITNNSTTTMMTTSTMKQTVEDEEVELQFPVGIENHRRILAGGINYDTLQKGPAKSNPAKGAPYTQPCGGKYRKPC